MVIIRRRRCFVGLAYPRRVLLRTRILGGEIMGANENEISETKKFEFSDDEKDKLLVAHNYNKIVGYALDYVSDDEKVIITLDEIRKWVGEPAQVYYFEEGNDEYARDLEDAWDCLVDELLNSLGVEDEEIVYASLKKELGGE